MEESLRQTLMRGGATIIGFASVREALSGDITHLSNAISIGLKAHLKENALKKLKKLQKKAARYLKEKGYRYLCIPPDSDRITDTFVSRLYPLFTHKIAATSAGIGWIGRNSLLINPLFGPKLSLATVLTDAPLQIDTPFEQSMCGDCKLCVEHCPSGAITGEKWSRNQPFPDLIRIDRCMIHKESMRSFDGKPNCGLCISICPYGRINR